MTISFFAQMAVGAGLVASLVGCYTPAQTDTARTNVEQLLLSNAGDRAFAKPMPELSGKKVFLDTSMLDSVDKNYMTAIARAKILREKGILAADAAGSDLIFEMASGGVGTDRDESLIGIPALPVPIPFASTTVLSPEIGLYASRFQSAGAKFNVSLYNTATRDCVAIYPALYGDAYYTRHALFTFIHWSWSDLPEDQRNTTEAY